MSAAAKPLPSSEKTHNRREFLYYIGGASLALITAGTCGGVLWFTTPDPRAGEIAVDMAQFNLYRGYSPQHIFYSRDAEAYLSTLNNNLFVLDAYCVLHEPVSVIVRWIDTLNCFACPACGSRYALDGTHIQGSARRGLDRFAFRVTASDGSVLTSNDGSPIDIRDAVDIVVDTQRRIRGIERA
jgi:cytochrome b6-f complex iron-sulfur subunit